MTLYRSSGSGSPRGSPTQGRFLGGSGRQGHYLTVPAHATYDAHDDPAHAFLHKVCSTGGKCFCLCATCLAYCLPQLMPPELPAFCSLFANVFAALNVSSTPLPPSLSDSMTAASPSFAACQPQTLHHAYYQLRPILQAEVSASCHQPLLPSVTVVCIPITISHCCLLPCHNQSKLPPFLPPSVYAIYIPATISPCRLHHCHNQ